MDESEKTMKTKAVLKKILSALLTLALILGATLPLTSTVIEAASPSATYGSELWMLSGYNKALVRGVRTEVTASPYNHNDATAYLPLSVVSLYTGATFTLSGNTATVTRKNGTTAVLTADKTEWSDNGTDAEFGLPVVKRDGEIYLSILSANALFGLYSFYNLDIGLVVLSERSMSYNRKTFGNAGLEGQIATLCALLFDRPSGQEVYDDIASGVGLSEHPRILADADKFATLRAILNGDPDGDIRYSWVNSFYLNGFSVFESNFVIEGSRVLWKDTVTKQSFRQPYYIYDQAGNRLVGKKEYTYVNADGETVTEVCQGSGYGDGYDVGGRSNPSYHTVKLKYLAFTWQMTGEKKYADAFYLIAKEMGDWEHWGEGHFLNCADAAVEYAIGFDWIYHAFDNEPDKRKEMAQILYDKGLMMGYRSINNISNGIHVSTVARGGWDIKDRTNNWQTVCGSGMVVSALALMEYPEFASVAKEVTGTLLSSLEKCLMLYAPDGFYYESPGYWVYGTQTLFVMLGALESSAGSVYGYEDIIGLKKSCYFARYICDTTYHAWGFHDGNSGTVNCSLFPLASRFYNDPVLAKLRLDMIEDGAASPQILDILYYEPGMEGEGEVDLPLDIRFRGYETVTMRSSWESDGNFAGLHVGPNAVAHGDLDAGNFYLTMNGLVWAGDLGSDDYNVNGYWTSSSGGTYGKRFRYFRKSAQSHNLLLIRSSSLPFGQRYTAMNTTYATIDGYYSDEYGAYAYSDMKYEYGATCTKGLRGLMMTNSRNTVIVQDEIDFSSPTSFTWLANINGLYGLSDDGKTAYARQRVNDKPVILRATLISEDESLKFTISAKDVLGNIITPEEEPKASNLTRRLMIEGDDKTSVRMAVVFEIMRHEDEVVGYREILPMTEWQTESDEWVKEANKDIEYPVEKPPAKYKGSSFLAAVQKYDKAQSLAERRAVILETLVYLTDYEEDRSTLAAVEKYREKIAELNAEIAEENKKIREYFLKSLPSADPF